MEGPTEHHQVTENVRINGVVARLSQLKGAEGQ
jgi:hypothetical protein